MLIEIEKLSVTYDVISGEPVLALSDIDLTVKQGEFVSILGASGCGKSTLLRVLTGLMQPSSGVAKIGNTILDRPRSDVGIVFQDARLLPWLNVLENVLIPIRVQRKREADYIDSARSLLSLAGLDGFADKYPSELSGGMQQRVAICRALVHKPATLLMDEPFGALDAMTREIMNLELLRIWDQQKPTVLFVTHSIPEAIFLADRIVMLTPRPGRIREIIDVGLPRPRDMETMATPAFAELAGRIRRMFAAEGEFH